MKEFIYPIKKIFQHNDELCSQSYYIGPYQRGYKWASSSRYDQVPQLLFDVYDAFSNNLTDYYLQYITVKRDNEKNRLEVIDGQQRLTTLSLIFYLLPAFGKENIALDRVVYARYKDSNVFSKVIDHMDSQGEENDKNLPQQDFFYLVRAARCIKRFLDVCQDYNKLDGFIEYLENKVLLIVNEESEFVSSEEIFMNLNENRVPLTNTYLIKGLLLTKAARRTDRLPVGYSYKEILDQRVIMGRQWDEMYSWIELPHVSHYFFGKDDVGMEGILHMALKRSAHPRSHRDEDKALLAPQKIFPGTEKSSSDLELFNQFNEMVKDEQTARDLLESIKHIYRKLRGIYENYQDSRLYNLLGYVLFCRKTTAELKKFQIDEIIDKTKPDCRNLLKSLALQAIPDLEACDCRAEDPYKDYRYGSNNDKLTNLLLAFSVFPEVEDATYRFNFREYNHEKWTFEHISPQHPKAKVIIDKSAKKRVIDKIKENYQDDENKLQELIQNISQGKQINADDIAFLYGSDIDIHSLGNMTLLSGGANSALNNNPYLAKRGILFSKQNEGYFIPKHTMDVFNKVLNTEIKESFTPDLMSWNNQDIAAHIAWMVKRNILIRKELSK